MEIERKVPRDQHVQGVSGEGRGIRRYLSGRERGSEQVVLHIRHPRFGGVRRQSPEGPGVHSVL